MTILAPLFFILALSDSACAAPYLRSLSNQVPILRRGPSRRLNKSRGAVGLGDVEDSAYSIQVSIGPTTVPLILDTGSSDLWSISTGCTAVSCGAFSSSTPQISISSLQSANLPARLDYGDSAHRTFASGIIGSGSVSVAGLEMDNQFLAACDTTNTNLSDIGLSGIFGLGFPSPVSGNAIFSDLMGQSGPIDADAFISHLPIHGPFMSRLVANSRLREPMFTVTLERETVEVGGNLGQLTIGALPDGVSHNSLTWVPVRLYTSAQGGLSGSTSTPNEVYPIHWEVPLDDVVLNGQTLPRPQLWDGIGYTAAVDSGTSFISGPQNLVSSVYSSIARGDSSNSGAAPPMISCTSPVHLSFVIGGKTFPVDPRDFLSLQTNGTNCDASSLLPADPPSAGMLMSWVLGAPFMKSNLVAFYLGNLTHPSVDPPRIGFLSTVPSNADTLLQADVKAAQTSGGFIASSITAPQATLSATHTDANGVAQAPMGTLREKDGALLKRILCMLLQLSIVMALVVFM